MYRSWGLGSGNIYVKLNKNFDGMEIVLVSAGYG
jgi:hypothetical protein